MEPKNEAQKTNDAVTQPTEGPGRADSAESGKKPTVGRSAFGFRRLPLKMLYRPMELSAESEEMLDEAMVRLDTDSPDVAVKAALTVFLREPKTEIPE